MSSTAAATTLNSSNQQQGSNLPPAQQGRRRNTMPAIPIPTGQTRQPAGAKVSALDRSGNQGV